MSNDAQKLKKSAPWKDAIKDTIETKSVTKIFENNAKHIFRNAEGHLPDTLANRQLLVDLTSDFKNFLGSDKYGTEWFARLTKDGKQIWAGVRKGSIRYGGMNETPKIFNSGTGLSRLMTGIKK